MTFLKLLAITIVLLVFALIAFGIRRIFDKKAAYPASSCSSVNPETGERAGCACGSEDGSCATRPQDTLLGYSSEQSGR